MSLFSVIAKGAKVLAGAGIIRGKVGQILGGPRSGPKVQMPLPGVAGPIAGLPVSRVAGTLARRGARAIPGIAGGVAAGLALDKFGQPKPKKRRRINPCNDKALRRALRRVEMYDKQRKRVDQALRKACPPSRRRAAPSRSGAHKH